MVYSSPVKQSQGQPTASQRALLEALADGGIIAVVHTRGGTIASLFPREGRHRNISYKLVTPMLQAGWVEDVVPEPLRWRGSKYVISATGRRVVASVGRDSGELAGFPPTASEAGFS
jgi:alpha-beta hydrolase superfamily lysophospholipase